MTTTLKIGLLDLARHWRMALAMALVVAVTISAYLIIRGYHSSLANTFQLAGSNYLIVGEQDVVEEYFGSRIPASAAQTLAEMGVREVIPEIRTATGTSAVDATMIRGIDLQRYSQVVPFEMLSGDALSADSLAQNSASRLTMLGWRLARRLEASPGDVVQLRGREFRVTGVFRTGTYADNEAWMPLETAQALLNWSDEVSIYLIPDDGILQPGQTLPGGLQVTRQSDVLKASFHDYEPILSLFGAITRLLAAAAVLALANVLLRLAWAHRYELAMLRCLGFSRRAAAVYLLGQGSVILLSGAAFGAALAWLLSTGLQFTIAGLDIYAQFSANTLLVDAAWILALALAGAALPILWVSRLPLGRLVNQR